MDKEEKEKVPVKLFKLEDANHRTEIDARHRLGLPGLVCPLEGPWGTLGIAYPSLTVKDPALVPKLVPRPVDLESFSSILDEIRCDIGETAFSSRTWMPGAKLGPLEGNGRGKQPGGLIVDLADLLIERSAFARLAEVFQLCGVEARIQWSSKFDLSLMEVELLPSLSFVEDDSFRICDTCGRVAVRVPDEPTVRIASYRQGYGLYRGKLCTTVILCDEEFKREAEALGLSGVDFVPVRTIE